MASPMTDQKNILSFEVDKVLLDKLRKASSDNYRSVSAQVRLILNEWLQNKEADAK